MKKLYLLLVLSFIAGRYVSAQTVTSTYVNFAQLAAYEAQHPELSQQCATCPRKEADAGWRNLSNSNLPIPAGAKITTLVNTGNQPTPNNPSSPLAASILPVQNWLGHLDPGQSIPPDTHGSVGPNHVVTTTNDFVRIHAKAGGGVISSVGISTFTGIANTCDPYLIYDPGAARFYFSTIECTSNGNRVILMISNTSDPTGVWRKITWVPSSTDGSVLLDHPYLGFDGRWLVVTGRKFPSGFSGPILFLFDKTAALNGTPITFGTNAQTIEKSAAEGDCPSPVSVYEAPFSSNPNPSPNTFNILQSWNNTSLRLSTVTGNIPTATWNTASAVFPTTTLAPWNNGNIGNLVQQVTETRRLAVNDARVSSAIMMNGHIFCVHHVALPSAASDRVAVQYWELDAATGSFGAIVKNNRIGGASAGDYKWFPNIAANKFGDILIGYSASNTTSHVGAAYVTRPGGSPASYNTDDEYIYKTGLDIYWKDFNSGRARWGDYSHATLDPTDNSLWTINEYADVKSGGTGDNNSRYGVWWAQVLFPSSLSQRDASVSAITNPSAGQRYCNFPITPSITILNRGTDTLKNVQYWWSLDGVNQGTAQTWNTPPGLATLQTTSVNLAPALPGTLTGGAHIIKAWTQLPNGLADQNASNDTATITFLVQETLPLPALQGFEPASDPMPPTGGWGIINPDGGITWVKRLNTTGPTGALTSVMTLNAYNYGSQGQKDIFRTPKIDLTGVDSIKMNFDLSYAPYPGYTDSLEIVYSTDCGLTFNPLPSNQYKKAGKTGGDLNTQPGTTGSFVPSAANMWRNEAISFGTCGISSPTIMLGFRFINGFGNNIYIDNINIRAVNSFSLNAAALSITSPSSTLCSTSFSPVVVIGNSGFTTMTSATINYSVDGGAVSTYSWTGNLPRCSTAVITLSPITSVAGNHILTVYTTNPNGSPDQFTGNDTTRKPFSISPQIPMPIFEGFESPTFPPVNWSLQNPDGLTTWARTTAAARSGVASMWINNPAPGNASSAIDKFYSPVVVNPGTTDSIFLAWDHAYMPGVQYPGSTVTPLDTLEVQVTTDCGATFKTIWKKWGADLQTINDPNYAYNPSYTPGTAGEWRNTRIFLTPYVGTSNFQVYFVMKGNKQNNLFIDNININSKTLPARLKNQGYLIYPSPFTTTFKIHHWIAPVDLQAAQVYNAVGQMVWDMRFNGDAPTEINVDMSKLAAGGYVLKMIYTNKTIVERIIKQ